MQAQSSKAALFPLLIPRQSSDSIIFHRKANELLRLIALKNLRDVNEMAKVIFCIDSASMLCGTAFDHPEVAIRLSGLKPKDYAKKKQMFDKLLGLTKQIKVSDVCVQLEMPEGVQSLAEKLLDTYRLGGGFSDDIESPQNVAMAVYQCCKHRNLKVKVKSKLIAISNIEPAKWKRLEEQWDKWIETAQPFSRSSAPASKRDERLELEPAAGNDRNASQQAAHVEEVPYEEWKQSLLEKAMRAAQKATDAPNSGNTNNPSACAF